MPSAPVDQRFIVSKKMNREIMDLAQLRTIVAMSRQKLSRNDSFFVATQLTKHGFTNPARELIGLLEGAISNRNSLAYLDSLRRICGYLESKRSVHEAEADRPLFERLMSQETSFLRGEAHPDRLIIVLATCFNDFTVSFPVLHSILRQTGHSVLYVKNPEMGEFLTGTPGFGTSIDEMADHLARYRDKGRFTQLRVMGQSTSCGYASLLIAARLSAESYLGFGINTDLSAKTLFGAIGGKPVPDPEAIARNTRVNLRHLPEITRIGAARLYFGARDQGDRANAETMADLTNFEIEAVADATHAVIMTLMAENRFDQVLEQFVSAPLQDRLQNRL